MYVFTKKTVKCIIALNKNNLDSAKAKLPHL